MGRYAIKACEERKWYVIGFLIPSLIEQGIPPDEIYTHFDDGSGCLETSMRAFRDCPNDNGGTWFLQDDVVISKRFVELTRKHDSGVICGHCFPLHGDRTHLTGFVKPENMWFSFPCIRVPHTLAHEVADWFFGKVVPENMYPEWVKAKKYDDTLFDVFIREHHPDMNVLNLVPNLVAHIDYLIGGSAILGNGEFRRVDERYFDEPDVIDDLKRKLASLGGTRWMSSTSGSISSM